MAKCHAIHLPESTPMESFITGYFSRLQRQAEQSESLDELTEVADKASGAKLTFSEKALGTFWREKAKTLKLIEEKFNGRVKVG